MYLYPGKVHLHVMMSIQTISRLIFEGTEAIHDNCILNLTGIYGALKTFFIVEALPVMNAGDEKSKEMQPTFDVQAKACTGRSLKWRKQ